MIYDLIRYKILLNNSDRKQLPRLSYLSPVTQLVISVDFGKLLSLLVLMALVVCFFIFKSCGFLIMRLLGKLNENMYHT